MFQSLFKKYFAGDTFGYGMGFAGGKQFALTPSPGPPFLLTSADNGLSVDPSSFRIVLGQDFFAVGDPAQLLSNREIPLAGFDLVFSGNGSLSNRMLELDDNNNYVQLASFGAGFSMYGGSQASGSEQIFIIATDLLATSKVELQSNTFNQFARLQQDSSLGNSTMFTLDNTAASTAIILFNSNPFFELDFTGVYSIGDIAATNKSSRLVINDTTSTDVLQTTDGLGNKSELLLIGVGGTTVASMFTIDNGVTTIAAIDGTNGSWRAFESNNGTFLRMQGFNQTIQGGIDNGSVFRMLELDIANTTYTFGDMDNFGNGVNIQIFDSSSFISFLSSSNYTELQSWDFFAGVILIGDVTGIANGTQFKIDDVGKLIDINNITNDVAININGVPGFTGTVTPVTSITVNHGIVTNVA